MSSPLQNTRSLCRSCGSSTLRLQQETVWLASLLSRLGVIPAEPTTDTNHALPNVARGALLCQAFETYRAMVPSSQISFEHAVFLAITLSRGEQLRLGACVDCGSLVVTERFPIRNKRCQAECPREAGGLGQVLARTLGERGWKSPPRGYQ